MHLYCLHVIDIKAYYTPLQILLIYKNINVRILDSLQLLFVNLNQIAYNKNQSSQNTSMSLEKSEVKDRDNNLMNRSIYNSKIMMGFNSLLNSPTNAQREIYLRKSRIVNIPSNKKQNLSQKLEFVVVFQTIQIQRLNQQLQTLSTLVHDYERKAFNIQNYEIQIRELTQKCYRLQNQRNALRQQLAQNKDVSQNIYRELQDIKKRYLDVDFASSQKYKLQKSRNEQLLIQVQKWKSRYHAIDQSKSNQLNSIKTLMEEQKRSLLTRQTKDLFQRFQNEKQALEQKNKELKRNYQQKQNQLKKTKNFLTVLEKQRENDQKELEQYQQKVALLSQQNYRLSEMIKMKQNQLKKTKIQIDSSMNLKMSQINSKEEQKSILNTKIQRIHKQLQEKQFKINQLQRINLQNKSKLAQKERLQFLLTEVKEEINGKNKLLERKDKKIFALQQDLSYLIKIVQEVKTLKSQNLTIKQQINFIIEKIEKQISFIKNIKKSFIQKIEAISIYYKNMQKQMTLNIKKAYNYSQTLMAQIEKDKKYMSQMQVSYSKLKKTIQNLQYQKQQKLRITSEKQRLQNQLVLKDNQTKTLNSKVYELIEQKNNITQSTFGIQQKLKLQNEQFKKQIQFYKTKDSKNIKLLEQLQFKINSNYQQLSQQRYKNSQIFTKNQSLNKIIKEKQHQIKEKQYQIDHLIQRLQTFQKSENDLKIQIQTVLKRVDILQDKIVHLRQFFNNTYQKQKHIFETNKCLQQNCKNLVDQYALLSEKNSRLYQILLEVNSSSNGSNIDMKAIKNLSSQNYLKSNSRLNNENINNSNFIDNSQKIKSNSQNNPNQRQIPLEFLIRYILLSVQVQSLRQRAGDKNAKIQNIKNNLKLSNASNSRGKQSLVRNNKLMQNELSSLNYDGNRLIRKVTSQQHLDQSSVLQVDISSTDKSGIYTSKRGSLGKGIFKGISIKKSTYY